MSDDAPGTPEEIARELAAARARLSRLRDLVAAADASLDRVGDVLHGATDPLVLADPDVLEQDGLGLRPWLDALCTAAADGRRPADIAGGLARWKILAERTELAAAAVTAANTAPLRQHRELRGRLQAAHAKATRLGLTEEEHLAALYARARGTLDRAPTDLALAEDLTMAYVRALDDRESGAAGPARGGATR